MRVGLEKRSIGASVIGTFVLLTICVGAASGPNILWLTSEDNGVEWVGCYGNPHAETPHLDALAADGFRYTRCYANAPVCAPSRSTWITGMLAISNGTFPMRSRYPIPHDRIAYYPDLLRAAGVYTGNDRKTDYNIGGRDDSACWDQAGSVDWSALKARQPFFQVINFTESHESKAQGETDRTQHSPEAVSLPPYHPDLSPVRRTYAKYHDAVRRMDERVGEVLTRLEAEGLAEDTIVVYTSDHGGVLPRSKRFLFKSGLHCPLIIRIPDRYRELWPDPDRGSTVDRLVSFLDMPKTWVSLAGAPVPETMQGRIFLGPETEPEPAYHFAFRGRMDERIDNARALIDGRYLYIRNYMPHVPWMQHLDYLWKMEATQAWADHVAAGRATAVQGRYFEPKAVLEELYDLESDPANINNLAGDPDFQNTLQRFRQALRTLQLAFTDTGLLPESEMVRLAGRHGLTLYELARDSSLYDLPALLDASDLALEGTLENREALVRLLDAPDAGSRYWGMAGCFGLGINPPQLLQLLSDESHEIRLLAAWMLFQQGEDVQALACLETLIKESSYAMLSVLNTIDWMGLDAAPLLAEMPPSALADPYVQRMVDILRTKAIRP